MNTLVTNTAIPIYNNLGENTVQMNKWCLCKIMTLRYNEISIPLENKYGGSFSDIEMFFREISLTYISNHKMGPEKVLKAIKVPTGTGSKSERPM